MTKLLAVSLAVLAVMSAAAQENSTSRPGQKAPPVGVWSSGPGVGSAKRTTTVTAKVLAVDVPSRMMTLQPPQGPVQTIKVDPAVKRLGDIVPGDTITVKREQRLTLEYQPPGTAPVDGSVTSTETRADASAPPAGTQSTQVRATVAVVQVDPLYRVVTLQDGRGDRYQVTAGADIDLARVETGQKYLATFTDTTAVAVEKARADGRGF